jgi:hypothetical protein
MKDDTGSDNDSIHERGVKRGLYFTPTISPPSTEKSSHPWLFLKPLTLYKNAGSNRLETFLAYQIGKLILGTFWKIFVGGKDSRRSLP